MTTLEVSKEFGVSLRQLQWWAERGVVMPTYTDRGMGSYRNGNREYDTAAVRRVSLVAHLRRKGLSLQRIRTVLKKVGDQTGILIVGRKKIGVVPEALALWSIVNQDSPVVVVQILEDK